MMSTIRFWRSILGYSYLEQLPYQAAQYEGDLLISIVEPSHTAPGCALCFLNPAQYGGDLLI